MGSMLACEADESSLNCPFGSCAVKHCKCLRKQEEDPESSQINAAIRVELEAVVTAMREKMRAILKRQGSLANVKVTGCDLIDVTVDSLLSPN
jgi:hypothetical protein